MLPFLIFLTAATLECILIALVPAMSLLTAILWGATLILAGTYIIRSQLISIVFTNLAVLFILTGINGALLFILFFGAAGLLMSLLANRGADYYLILNSGAIAAVIGVSIYLTLFFFGMEEAAVANQKAEFNIFMQEALDNFEDSDLFNIYEEQGITKEDIQESFEEMVTIIFKHLPAVYYIQAIMVIFFMLILAQRLSQTFANQRLRKKAFNKEIMPWQLVWVFIAGLGLWIWGRGQATAIYYIGSNILAVMIPITIYYGLAVALYLLSKIRKRKNIWITVLIIFSVVVFTAPLIILLVLMGLFDSLMDYRKIRIPEEV